MGGGGRGLRASAYHARRSSSRVTGGHQDLAAERESRAGSTLPAGPAYVFLPWKAFGAGEQDAGFVWMDGEHFAVEGSPEPEGSRVGHDPAWGAGAQVGREGTHKEVGGKAQ